jgi:hypothetical protein
MQRTQAWLVRARHGICSTSSGIALSGHRLCAPAIATGMRSGAGLYRIARGEDPLELRDCRGEINPGTASRTRQMVIASQVMSVGR